MSCVLFVAISSCSLVSMSGMLAEWEHRMIPVSSILENYRNQQQGRSCSHKLRLSFSEAIKLCNKADAHSLLQAFRFVWGWEWLFPFRSRSQTEGHCLDSHESGLHWQAGHESCCWSQEEGVLHAYDYIQFSKCANNLVDTRVWCEDDETMKKSAVIRLKA